MSTVLITTKLSKEVGSSNLLVHSANRDMWVAQHTDSVLRLMWLLQNLRGGGAATYPMQILNKSWGQKRLCEAI